MAIPNALAEFNKDNPSFLPPMCPLYLEEDVVDAVKDKKKQRKLCKDQAILYGINVVDANLDKDLKALAKYN